MADNIICSGALFYAINTKRFLLLQRTDFKTRGMWGLVGGRMRYTESAFEGLKRGICIENEFIPKLNKEHSGYAWCNFECWPKNLHAGLRNTLNNKAIKGKLQTILDLIT